MTGFEGGPSMDEGPEDADLSWAELLEKERKEKEEEKDKR